MTRLSPPPTAQLQQQVEEAVRAVRRRWSVAPRAGLILGTGLGGLARHVQADVVIPYAEIPHFPWSTALSHKSLLVCGALDGVPVVTMQGRCHLYEGYAHHQLALPVRVMHALGAQALVVSNASGGMNPRFHAGDIMVISDHINLMWDGPAGLSKTGSAAVVARPGKQSRLAYDGELIEEALAIARREQFVAHRGVYVGVTGPTYETRSEYRLFRRIGGDVVGMSTVPEVIAAQQCGLRVLALSLVTNVAKPDAPTVVDAEDVVQAAEQAAPNMHKIVQGVLSRHARV